MEDQENQSKKKILFEVDEDDFEEDNEISEDDYDDSDIEAEEYDDSDIEAEEYDDSDIEAAENYGDSDLEAADLPDDTDTTIDPEDFDEYDDPDDFEEVEATEEFDEFDESEETEEPEDLEATEASEKDEDPEETEDSEEFDDSEEADDPNEEEPLEETLDDLEIIDDKPSPGVEKVSIILGIICVVLILIAGGVFAYNKLIKPKLNASGDTQVTKEVGAAVSGIDIIGGEGIENAFNAMLSEAPESENSEQEYTSEEPEDEGYQETDIKIAVSVSIDTVSVMKDLKIRFVNDDSKKLIPNIPFEVEITDPNGKTETWVDEDKDGTLYAKDMTPGEYSIHMVELTDEKYSDITYASDCVALVRKDLEYKPVDVGDEILDPDSVDEGEEDPDLGVGDGEEGNVTPTDTVPLLESTQTVEYSSITKDDIALFVSGQGISLTTSVLDVSGNETMRYKQMSVYLLKDGSYIEATYTDYFDESITAFYVPDKIKYTGWQTINGVKYYFNADGIPVTGEQIIGGVTYKFDETGALITGETYLGIDVSKWNGNIDWSKVAESGVSFVIIRVGYRGSSKGNLIDDKKFKDNITGATNAGLKVGIYFVTQAIDDVEALYEASMVLDRIKGYSISYPIFIDVEATGGRGDKISKEVRTSVIKTFCETIQNAGYTAGIYANKTWLQKKMDLSQLNQYKIWMAQYNPNPTDEIDYDLWQYTDKGSINGISGDVDMNYSYMGY